jgi:hypothetical protein
MKRTGQIVSTKRMKIQNLTAANKEKQPPVGRSKQGSKKDLLLRHPNFVAKSTDASFEPPSLACEAGASQVMMNWTRTGKRGTTNGVRRQMNPELGLQVYLTFSSKIFLFQL